MTRDAEDTAKLKQWATDNAVAVDDIYVAASPLVYGRLARFTTTISGEVHYGNLIVGSDCDVVPVVGQAITRLLDGGRNGR